MQKWVTLGLVAAASLGLAGISFADVPSSLTSTVVCQCVADAGGGASSQLPYKCTITPSGTSPSEDVQVNVVVRNVLGAPLAGSTVVITSVGVSGATFIWDNGLLPIEPDEDPQTGLSNGVGVFNAVFDEGGVNNTPTPTLPNLDFSITAAGPGPGGAIALTACAPQLQVLSFDLNASGAVNLADFAIFAGDFGAGNARSDFNWSTGAPNLADFALFAASFGDDINNQ